MLKLSQKIKSGISPWIFLVLLALVAKILMINYGVQKKSYYQNYDPEKIAKYTTESSSDKQEIEIPPSKVLSNGHTNNNNEFKFKCLSLEQASIDVFKKGSSYIFNNLNKGFVFKPLTPIYLSNRSILI